MFRFASKGSPVRRAASARPAAASAITKAAVATVATVAALSAVAGCGSGAESTVRDAAAGFVGAVGAGDAGRACELLTSDAVELLESMSARPCVEALPELDLPGGPVTEVRVWGDAAQASTAADTVFLRRVDGGWRVVAAGCQPGEPQRPYECTLDGS